MKVKNIPIIILMLAILLYGNTLLNGWGMDDNFVLKDNDLVKSGIRGIPEIFSSPYYSGPSASFGYRPLTKAMFAIEYSIFGDNLPINHLINVLLYAICGILVFRFLKRYLEQGAGLLFLWTAFFLWFFHPVHTEVVCSLKNREEMMWMIFGLLSLEHFERYIERAKIFYIFSAVIFFILSFLAKQSALSLLMVLPLLLWYKYKFKTVNIFTKQNIRIVTISIIFLICGIILYKLTYFLFSKDDLELSYFENPLRFNENMASKVSLVLLTFLFYFKILFFPHPLVFYYGLYSVPEIPVVSFPVVISIIFLITLTIIFLYGVRKKTVLSFGIGFVILSLFMFSNIPEKVNGIIGERLLFFPSVGFSVMLSSLFFITFNIKRDTKFSSVPLSFKIILVLVLSFFAGKTIVRNTTWKDSLRIFRNDIRYAENSVQANTILAGEMMDRVVAGLQKGFPVTKYKSSSDSIILLYKRAWKLYPKNYRVLNNLGDIYMTFRNDPDTALLFLSGAYKLEPENFYVCFNIARGFEMKKSYFYALYFYKKAAEIKPEKMQSFSSIERIKAIIKNDSLASVTKASGIN